MGCVSHVGHYLLYTLDAYNLARPRIPQCRRKIDGLLEFQNKNYAPLGTCMVGSLTYH